MPWIGEAYKTRPNAARLLHSPFALLGASLLSAAVVARPPDGDAASLRGFQTKPVLEVSPAPQAVPGRLIIKYGTPAAGFNEDLPRTLPNATGQVLDRLVGIGVLSRRPLLRSPAMARQPQAMRQFWQDRVILRQVHGLTDIEVLTVPAATDVAALCLELTVLPEIEWAHPDYLFTYDMEPDDPYYHSAGSWGQAYDDLYGPKLLDCSAAWDITQGEGVVVAVVDSGVDYNHPDLAANMWVNPPEDINSNGRFDNWPVGEIRDGVTGDLDGLDNDGNGYVDDVVGYDFVGDGQVPDPDPMDPLGHGTHVAGTVAAVGNNALGIIGVAPQARIMALKVGGDGGSGVSVSAAAEAVVYLADNGARVSNSSWGGFLDMPELRAAFEYATDADAISVVSAGNASGYAEFYFPASYETTITVAATDHEDYKAPFSNFGMSVDVAAPGGGESEPADVSRPDYSILSLLAADSTFAGWPYIIGGEYMRLAGTSMAAPHVAGVAALVRSAYPNAFSREVRGRLKAGAESIDQLNPGFQGLLGAGRVNALLSLTVAPQPYLEVTNVRVLGGAIPDRSFELVVTLRNEWRDAHNAQFTLSCTAPGVTVTQPQATVGHILGGQEADNGAEPFEIHLDSTIAWGQQLPFAMSCQYDEGTTAFDFPVAVQVFQNVIAETGLPASGASSISLYMQDLNGDDYPDVLVPYALDTLRFFRNQTDGSFAEVPLPLAVHSVYGISMADLDDDGLRDIVAPGNVIGGPIYTHIYRQLAHLQFEMAPHDGALEGLGGADTLLLDFNADGLPDVLSLGDTAVLLENLGGFSFANASDRLPSGPITSDTGVEGALADYDNDGHPDLIVAGGVNGLRILRNRGDGTYDDVTGATGVPLVFARDMAVGDFDNDGWTDIFVGDYKEPTYDGSAPANRLLRNNANGTFTDVTAQSGDIHQTDPTNRPAAYGGSECFDYDNDGDLDIFVQCGDSPADPAGRLYRNNGDGTFSDVTAESITLPPGVRYTATYGDYDDDGDLDIYLSDSVYGAAGFHRNHTASLPDPNHWIKIRLFGIESNRDGFGARITVLAGDRAQIRDVTSCDRAAQPVHFGLGEQDRVDRVIVRWPSGVIQYHADIPADRTITLIEGQGASCGDLDGDGRIDLVDFATFALCFSGDGNTVCPAACADEAWLNSDCDGDGDVDLRDFATFAANFNGSSGLLDCNGNAIPDECDLSCGPAAGPCDLPGCGQSEDCNANAIPDECEPLDDCNGNGVQDICDIAAGTSADEDGDDIPDECEAPLRFVRADAPPGGTGLTWATAFHDLQDALDAAAEYGSPVAEIWVAAGTYRPDRGTGNRNARFQLLDGVAIYGGFAGNEDPEAFDLGDRDFEVNETILSGDLAGDDGPGFANIQENARHVVDASRTGPTTVLDGFTITAGYADGAGNPVYDDSGAGMFNRLGDPTIRNTIFAANYAEGYGGGMMNHDRCDLTLINCAFVGNVAQAGGAMRNWMGTFTMLDCAFQGNSAQDGGAIYNLRSNELTLTGCSFIQNSAGGQGGAFHNDYDNTLEMTHCTFGQNLAEEGAALFATRYNHLTIHNCCFHENNATAVGGAAYLFSDNTASLSHCTLADNTAAHGRALATDGYAGQGGSQVGLTNCILWNGSGEVWNQDSSTIDITYSDVWDGLPGQGNISLDPLFVNGPAGAYYLGQTAAGQPQTSPCVDAGLGIPAEWGLGERTTRTDQEVDRQLADIGFHYAVVMEDDDPPPQDGDPAEAIDH